MPICQHALLKCRATPAEMHVTAYRVVTPLEEHVAAHRRFTPVAF
jgi:hypothetical protein